jgi:glycosidase
MGIGILWLNPVLENDQPEASYRGYAITARSKVDPRLGRIDAYARMIRAAHDRDMAVLQDVIFNHWGHRHWMIESLPGSSWIRQWLAFTSTNYNANVMTDPHAAASDLERFNRGWFVEVMPNLDPTDPVFSDLLIQNSLWWGAETGIDGFRVDTYPYSDQDFMARWGERVLTAFPDLFIFGKCWVNSPAAQAQYTEQV